MSNLNISATLQFLLKGGEVFKESSSQVTQLKEKLDSLVTAKNKLTDAGGKADQSLLTEIRDTKTAVQTTEELRSKVESAAAAINGMGTKIAAVGGAIVAALGVGVKEASDFSKKILEVAGNTDMAAGDIDKLSTSVKRMAQDSGAPLDQLADGMMHAANLGFTLAQSQNLTEVAMKKALVTGADVGSTTNVLANALHEFANENLSAADAMNVLHTASARGNMTLEQFNSAAGPTLALSASLGLKLEDVSAAFSALTRHGFDAAEASTQVKNMISHIINPSEEAFKAIKTLSDQTGIDLVNDFSAAGLHAKGLSGVMDDVAKATNGSAGAIQELIPAMRGGVGAMVLAGNGAKDYKEILGALNDKQAMAKIGAEEWERQQNSLAGQTAKLKEQLITFGIAIGDGLVPIIKVFTTVFGTVVGWFNAAPEPIKAVAAGLLAVMGAVLLGVGAFLKLAGIVTVIKDVQIAIEGMAAASTLAAAAEGAAALGADGLAVSATASIPSIGAMGAVLWGALAPVIPVLLVVIALVAVVGVAAAVIIKNWEPIKSTLKPTFDWFSDQLQGLIIWIQRAIDGWRMLLGLKRLSMTDQERAQADKEKQQTTDAEEWYKKNNPELLNIQNRIYSGNKVITDPSKTDFSQGGGAVDIASAGGEATKSLNQMLSQITGGAGGGDLSKILSGGGAMAGLNSVTSNINDLSVQGKKAYEKQEEHQEKLEQIEQRKEQRAAAHYQKIEAATEAKDQKESFDLTHGRFDAERNNAYLRAEADRRAGSQFADERLQAKLTSINQAQQEHTKKQEEIKQKHTETAKKHDEHLQKQAHQQKHVTIQIHGHSLINHQELKKQIHQVVKELSGDFSGVSVHVGG